MINNALGCIYLFIIKSFSSSNAYFLVVITHHLTAIVYHLTAIVHHLYLIFEIKCIN